MQSLKLRNGDECDKKVSSVLGDIVMTNTLKL